MKLAEALESQDGEVRICNPKWYDGKMVRILPRLPIVFTLELLFSKDWETPYSLQEKKQDALVESRKKNLKTTKKDPRN